MSENSVPELPTLPRFNAVVEIPPAAGAEIKRLHQDLVTKAKAFETARAAFGEFTRGTRLALGIPNEEQWVISSDASLFTQVPMNSGNAGQEGPK